MANIVYRSFFLLTTIYILLKVIGFGLYEIKEKQNKMDGITVISFSIMVVIFSNIMMWLS